jgi:hypothetical protein
MKKSITEKIALWFLRRRFASSIYLRMTKDGEWQISLRKQYRSWVPIDSDLAYELCMLNNVNSKTFVKSEERLIAKFVSAVV